MLRLDDSIKKWSSSPYFIALSIVIYGITLLILLPICVIKYKSLSNIPNVEILLLNAKKLFSVPLVGSKFAMNELMASEKEFNCSSEVNSYEMLYFFAIKSKSFKISFVFTHFLRLLNILSLNWISQLTFCYDSIQ